MAKLKDIFPRWLFKERGYGDLEVGGGSAFAHLTEHDNTGPGILRDAVIVDKRILVGDEDDPFNNSSVIGAGSYLGHFLHPGAVVPSNTVYELWPDEGNGNYPIFQWNEDGSLQWSDGTNQPDTSFGRIAPGVVGPTGPGSGLGVGQQHGGASEAGALVGYFQVFDQNGDALGFAPIYDGFS